MSGSARRSRTFESGAQLAVERAGSWVGAAAANAKASAKAQAVVGRRALGIFTLEEGRRIWE